MSTSLSDIRCRVTSDDPDVLKQSLEFLYKRLAHENERGKAAESRATVMLAVLGIITGLIIPEARTFTSTDLADGEYWFLLAAFVSCLLFLLRGLYYAIKVMGISKRHQILPDTIYDFQGLSPKDALREEVAAVFLSYHYVVQPNTEKLFFLHRCQRNGVLAICYMVFFGLAFIAVHEQWFNITFYVSICFGILNGILFLIMDPLCERFGGIWNK